MMMQAHTAQDKAKWNDLCTQWSRDAPKFTVVDPQKCPICEKCFKNVGIHITTTHAVSKEDFKCPHCEEVFKTKNARTRHLELKHGISVPKPFPCHHQGCKCGPFKTNALLQYHLRQKHQQVSTPLPILSRLHWLCIVSRNPTFGQNAKTHTKSNSVDRLDTYSSATCYDDTSQKAN